jgi:hypothetical protein
MQSNFAFAGTLWLIEVNHPEIGDTSYLQAEGCEGTYLLAFTEADKAFETIRLLGVRRGHPLCVATNVEVELATAMCQVGAKGIMVDFDPASPSDAFRCDLLVAA